MPDENEAVIFSQTWIAANIFPGPHSMSDRPIVSDIVEQFVDEAAEAGLSQKQLERSLGDIRVFLQRAFDDAQRSWKSNVRS